jgi:hypothetical protein
VRLDAAQVLSIVKTSPGCAVKLAPLFIEANFSRVKNADRAKRTRAARLSFVRS